MISWKGRETMSYVQRLGKSLMLPVSVMPIAALLKGIGYWIDPVGWGSNNLISAFLIESGSAIIDNLPLFFAIGVAVGMVKEKDTILSLCAVVSYLVVARLLSVETVSLIRDIPIEKVPIAFENSANSLVGILVGLVVAFNYTHFSKIQLPMALSFFGGKRFVPIISTVMMLLISGMLMVVWPALYSMSISFGEAISGLGPIGAGLYGFFNRLLVPTGLHHALNSVFWFDSAGINDIGKFWGTIPGSVVGETGMYQAGFFPVMMFGLPAAAIAIYNCARPEKKKQVGAVLLSAGFASFLTGVTEPLEFSFMFVAPILYVIHALMTGIMMFIAALFQWIAGFGFSAGLIDYILSIRSPYAHNIFMLIPLGIICGIIYYCIFRFMIIRYNLMTPGREIDDSVEEINKNESSVILVSDDYDELAIILLEALGGRSNVMYVDSCITRLRVELKNLDLVNEQQILSTGATGIVKVGKNSIQIIIGTKVGFIVDSINDILM